MTPGAAIADVGKARTADGALLAITLIWGSTFVVTKGALGGIGPFEFLALRFGLAFIALALIFHRRLLSFSFGELRAGALIGLWLLAGYVLQTVGLQYTSASRAGFITGLSVLAVPLIACILLRQRLGIGVGIGVALATAGLWFVSFNGEVAFGPGDLLVLGCAFAFACHIVAVGVYAIRYDPLKLTIVSIGVVAVATGLATPFMEAPLVTPAASVWLAIAYNGLIATALLLGIQTAAQQFTTSTRAAVIFSLEPVSAAIFAYWLAGDAFGPQGILGGALIVAGTMVAELKY